MCFDEVLLEGFSELCSDGLLPDVRDMQEVWSVADILCAGTMDMGADRRLICGAAALEGEWQSLTRI
jgi:hypothetical protein